MRGGEQPVAEGALTWGETCAQVGSVTQDRCCGHVKRAVRGRQHEAVVRRQRRLASTAQQGTRALDSRGRAPARCLHGCGAVVIWKHYTMR